MNPTWSPRGSQNGAKIVKIEVFEAPGFQRGPQVASGAPLGSILKGFWDCRWARQRVPGPPQGRPFLNMFDHLLAIFGMSFEGPFGAFMM